MLKYELLREFVFAAWQIMQIFLKHLLIYYCPHFGVVRHVTSCAYMEQYTLDVVDFNQQL